MKLKIRRKDLRPRVLKTQRDVLCDVMLAAGMCETWLTLVELARLTHFGEASISAQLRHLRKPEYGGFAVEKRTAGERRGDLCEVEHGPVWEYRLRRGARRETPAGTGRRPRSDELLNAVARLTLRRCWTREYAASICSKGDSGANGGIREIGRGRGDERETGIGV